MGLLSLAIWLPIAFGVLLLAVGNDRNAGVVRGIALVGAIVAFAVTLPLMRWLQMQTDRVWLRRAATVSMILIAVSIRGSQSRGGLQGKGAAWFGCPLCFQLAARSSVRFSA